MGVVFKLDKEPKDCLSCPMRQVIHEIDRSYQQCKSVHEGYKVEGMFKSSDLVRGWKSPKCPLIKEELNKTLKEAVNEIIQRMYIDTEGHNVLNGGSQGYEEKYKYEIGVNYGLKKSIMFLQALFPDELSDINLEAIIKGEENYDN